MAIKSIINLSTLGRKLKMSNMRSLFMAGATFLSLVAPGSANAILFSYDCANPVDCDGDTSFSFQIELADSVVSANGGYSTGSDGGAGFLGWTATSSVGDGFSISGGFLDVLSADDHIGFSFDEDGIIDGIWDTVVATNTGPFIGGDTFLSFREFGVGQVFWQEDMSILSRIDEDPTFVIDSDPISLTWSRVDASVPEPSIAILMASGLIAFGVVRRKARA